MATIEDVSPTRANTSLHGGQFTTGRMLSVDSSDDGQLVFAGSFSSNLWVSEDGGEAWSQVQWPQPDAGQFGVPGAIGGYCVTSIAVGPDSARWSVDETPRLLADVTGDKGPDIVGFGETGVWTALSNGDGTFAPPRVVLADFGAGAGGWQVDKHPRFLADVTGDGKADIVGFGDAGVYVARSNGDGTFAQAQLAVADFGFDQGWRVDQHPRFVVDLTGDGRADIIGFGNAGVYVALNKGDGTFTFTPVPVINDFGADAGGWRVDRHPRLLADLTGDKRADIVGFGNAGVYVARSMGNGTFDYNPAPVINDFGFDQGWRVDRHPRLLADLTGDKRADIVGFGNAGVYVALSTGNGAFSFTPTPAINDLGYDQGWRVDKHPRLLGDVSGEGRADIVGFGEAGAYVARSNGNGTFAFQPVPEVTDFGFDHGWRVDRHPRVLADITQDGRRDIVGFGDAGVYVSLSGRLALGAPRFVLANFGFEATVLAIAQCDRESQDAGVWRSSNRGATWSLVHSFRRSAAAAVLSGAGQLVWAPGTANLVYAAGGSSLAVSRDGGATFADVMSMPTGGFQPVNHVAVAATPAGALTPPVVYALFGPQIFVSFDAGVTWIKDGGTIPSHIGGGVGTFNSQNDRVMVVSPRSPLEVFVTGNANLVPPELWRGDYLQFLGTHTSQWEPMPLPNMGQQFSGNVYVAATLPGHGDVLFYGPQRSQTFAAPLDPSSAADWHALDSSHTHVDLHGIFLSPDFEATFQDGAYQSSGGTVWLASDGGIFRSTDGGNNFHAAGSISTLSVVNIAGVALEGQGPVIAMGTGDNDGFVTSDGASSWRPQDYGGGDDDCAWSDPLRPHSMLVFTPRWNEHGDFVGGGLGQTMALYEVGIGSLPDPSSSGDRYMVIGPPLRPGSTLWNATSGFSIRGYRPIVRNLPGDDPAQAGDYVVIRFFGNFSSPDLIMPNNLAILLRARNIRAIARRTDWDTPGGWRVEKHPRLLADLTGDGRADIVGFGDAGVWTALSTSGGSFADPHFVLADLGFDQGWRVEKHLRVLGDITGDGHADIVAFGDAGTYVALSNGSGAFSFTPVPAVADFGFDEGWRIDQHPRFVADITGDGRADIVGFGNNGVYVAVSAGNGTFSFTPVPVLEDFAEEAGGWHVNKHPRFLADITGDGRADIVGFGDAGVYVALSNGDGTFQPPRFVLADLGFDQGWRVEKHVRLLADITGDGRADIVAFGAAGVYVALSQGDGTFAFTPVPVIGDFGFEAGGWQVDKHPRFVADLTGDGRADIVGFGTAGVYAAFSNGDGTFNYTPVPVIGDFGVDQDWQVDRHPRFVADLTGDHCAGIIGFGDAGVLVGVNNGNGTFVQRALFVIPNFGFSDSGPVEQVGPFLPDPNASVVQASGGHTGTVFYVGADNFRRLWKWTDGMPAWQQLVPGGGASTARRFFVNPYLASTLYLLDTDHVRRSDDGGLTWVLDANLEQQLTDGGRIPATRDEDGDGQGDHYDVILSDMQFDPFDPARRFAVGLGGAFMTTDGVNWQRLLDTGAIRGRPANCYFDWISQPSDPAVYVSFAGRGIVKISGLTPQSVRESVVTRAVAAPEPRAARAAPPRQPVVRTGDGQVGTTQALPDERVLITLEDGRSFVVDTDQLGPQTDGTYLVDAPPGR